LNPTQWTGVVVFGCAALLCARAASISKVGAWGWIAVISFFCLLETVFGWRHRLHDFVISIIAPHGWYPSRRPFQALLLAILLVLFGLVASSLLKLWRKDRKAAVAAFSCLSALCLFLSEAISLHAVDAMLYRPIGPVLAIGWMWVLLASVTIFMAGTTRARKI